MALTLDGTQGMTSLLEEVVAAATRWTGADRVTLIQFDWEAREVRHFLRGGSGWAEVMTTIGFEELSAGLSGWALRTGEVALSPKDRPDPRESPEVQRRRKETHCGSIMVAPVGGPQGRLGTLTAINRPDQADFETQDAEGLAAIAQTAAWIIRLFQEKARTIRAQAEANAAIRSKTNFLSNLSHELRTPLNGVLGFSHLLDASIADPNQKAMVQTILMSGQRLLATVDNLLELAQFETGQFHLENAPFSPRAVLDAVVAKHSDLSAEKALTWKVSSALDLPVVLEGDAVRIGQAWNHVLSNAVKFTDRGSITVYLEANRTPEGRSELTLSVTDTGIGLSHESSGQWFKPFHQEDGSLTRKFGGTGLGLALCDRIVRKMGGGLSIRGEPGVGTSVRVWVDLGNERISARSSPHGLRVLLQDADPVNGLVMVKLLEKAGHRVDFVPTLNLAQERLGFGFYEVLMTEAPPANPQTLVALKEISLNPELHLIGLYALGAGPPKENGVAWTASLMKPVTYHKIEAALDRCLRGEEL